MKGPEKVNSKLLLAVLFLAFFMDGLDGSIVTIALPEIASDLMVDTATVSWTTASYMLALAGLLVLFARLSTDRGAKKVMMGGLALFTASSLICGMSTTFPMLVAFRLLQGVGAAMIAASGPIFCVKHFKGKEVATGLAVMTTGTAIGFAMGPAVGGLMLDFITWHWVFLINIPIGAACILAVLGAVPSEPEGRRSAIDWGGAVYLTSAIVGATLFLETVTGGGIAVPAASLAVSVVSLLAFIRHEKRRTGPLLDLGMFRHEGFLKIFLCLMFMNLAYMGILYILPFYGKAFLGYSSLVTGLVMMVSALTTSTFSIPITKLSNSHGRRLFCIASGIMLAVSCTVILLLAEEMTIPILVASMFFKGLGWALVGGPMGSNLIEHAGKEEREMASSLMNEAYYIGSAIGTALIAVVFSLFSGSMGIDPMLVPHDMFKVGFVASVAVVLAFGLLVSAISATVRDGTD